MAAELLLEGTLLLVGEDVEGNVYAGNAWQGSYVLCDGVLEVTTDRAAGRCKGDGYVNDAVGVDDRAADHAEFDDVLAELGVDDL